MDSNIQTMKCVKDKKLGFNTVYYCEKEKVDIKEIVYKIDDNLLCIFHLILIYLTQHFHQEQVSLNVVDLALPN